eukprot:TRINITY_DN3076_c1_g1_i2.p1 TRINITY_DN3076_c1_g1~~TRINITY_DN3076_c1_g1_i2.p1  ORF type:complete len:457 (-),score=78.84 TRINITY_DN3076_c1_g1_i2:175-1545(-)
MVKDSARFLFQFPGFLTPAPSPASSGLFSVMRLLAAPAHAFACAVAAGSTRVQAPTFTPAETGGKLSFTVVEGFGIGSHFLPILNKQQMVFRRRQVMKSPDGVTSASACLSADLPVTKEEEDEEEFDLDINSNASSAHIVFIVNPKGGHGKCFREWKKVIPSIEKRLSDMDIKMEERFTECPLHAVQLSREAIKQGARAVVAVGGDGTIHEVVNGFFDADGRHLCPPAPGRQTTALGLIPLGTGSDFARTFGWKTNDAESAIARIISGRTKQVDVGRVDFPLTGEHRHFINIADLHLSATVGRVAQSLKWMGKLCYAFAVPFGFIHHKNLPVHIKVDGGEPTDIQKLTLMVFANAKFFGGGMKVAPTADPVSKRLEMYSLHSLHWYDFLIHGAKLFKGTHTKLPYVDVKSVSSAVVSLHPSVEGFCGGVDVQADGEFIGRLPAQFSVLPSSISFLV